MVLRGSGVGGFWILLALDTARPAVLLSSLNAKQS